MLAAVLEVIFRLLFEVLTGFSFYWLGRVVVTLLTFGRLACDSYERESGWHDPWHITGRDEEGIFLTVEATIFVGVLAAVIIVGGYLYCRQ